MEEIMLDDMNKIAQLDKSDALGLAENTPTQLIHTYDIAPVTPHKPIENIVFSAMGGSALQAEFVKTCPELAVPFVVSKDYSLPHFVNETTLVIVASYSGNTEETLSAFDEAIAKGAMVAVMAGGGTLLERAKAHNLPFVEIPKAVQPRMAVFYAYRALIEMLVAFGVVDNTVLGDFSTIAGKLSIAVQQWVKDVPTDQNPAKQLALKMVGKTPIIYAGGLMAPAAYKWKIGINESAKNTAWYNILPEFNHNEFIGWSSHPVEKPFVVIDLLSSFEHSRVQKRFEVSDRLLSGMRPKAIRVEAIGDSAPEQLLYLVLFGDFVTVYMGILNGVDPSPVDLVEKFKKELN